MNAYREALCDLAGIPSDMMKRVPMDTGLFLYGFWSGILSACLVSLLVLALWPV